MRYKENTVKIPEKYYLSVSTRKTSNIHYPMGDFVVYGTDSAGAKRLATLKSRTKSEITEMINEPQSGFKLGQKEDTKYPEWLVEDPRGFSFYIPISCVSYLIDNTVIENGTILGKCVWAKHGSSNIILLVDSEEYDSAENFTKVANTKVDWANVKPGHIIQLTTGQVCEYMGKFYTIDQGYPRNGQNELELSSVKQHVIKITDYDNHHKPIQYSKSSSFKLSKIIDTSTEYDLATAEKNVNEVEIDYNRPLLSIKQINYKLIEVPVTFANEADFYDKNNHKATVYARSVNEVDTFRAISIDRYSGNNARYTQYHKIAGEPQELRSVQVSRGNFYDTDRRKYVYNATDSFFNLKLEIETPYGNTFSKLLTR